ncbi:MAG: glutaminyl-peptide cyclotransferase, partial [Ardenticatenales bacterium]
MIRRPRSHRRAAATRPAAWLAACAVAAALGLAAAAVDASQARPSGAVPSGVGPSGAVPSGVGPSGTGPSPARDDTAVRPAAIAQFPTPRAMTIDVLATHPHDRKAYTQGLVWDNGNLWESTGLYGESTLRRVALASGDVLQRRGNDGSEFAEGLALVDDTLIQLTWRAGKAFVVDKTTFEPLATQRYTGEGWGLCRNGDDLVMSDGSDTLFIRDAKTFEIKDRVPVQIDGEPLASLNELECAGDSVYANVWAQPFIVKIELATGDVTERIDGVPLDRAIRAAYGFADPYDCLNGIAYMPETDRFLVTGKHWPELYEVRFVPDGEPTDIATPPTPTPSPTEHATPTATPSASPTPARAYLPWGYR